MAGDELFILLVDILDKLGYNTESAGSATIFQRLAQQGDRLTATRAAYLDLINTLNTRLTDTRAGKLDLVGAVGDASTVATIFGRLLKNYEAISGGVKLDRTTHVISTNVVSSSLQTVLSVSGPGSFRLVCSKSSSATSEELKITRDGIEIFDITAMSSSSAALALTPSGLTLVTASNTSTSIPLEISFSDSLLIQAKGDGTYGAYVGVAYNI